MKRTLGRLFARVSGVLKRVWRWCFPTQAGNTEVQLTPPRPPEPKPTVTREVIDLEFEEIRAALAAEPSVNAAAPAKVELRPIDKVKLGEPPGGRSRIDAAVTQVDSPAQAPRVDVPVPSAERMPREEPLAVQAPAAEPEAQSYRTPRYGREAKPTKTKLAAPRPTPAAPPVAATEEQPEPNKPLEDKAVADLIARVDMFMNMGDVPVPRVSAPAVDPELLTEGPTVRDQVVAQMIAEQLREPSDAEDVALQAEAEQPAVVGAALVDEATVANAPLVDEATVASAPLVDEPTAASEPVVDEPTAASEPVVDEATVVDGAAARLDANEAVNGPVDADDVALRSGAGDAIAAAELAAGLREQGDAHAIATSPDSADAAPVRSEADGVEAGLERTDHADDAVDAADATAWSQPEAAVARAEGPEASVSPEPLAEAFVTADRDDVAVWTSAVADLAPAPFDEEPLTASMRREDDAVDDRLADDPALPSALIAEPMGEPPVEAAPEVLAASVVEAPTVEETDFETAPIVDAAVAASETVLDALADATLAVEATADEAAPAAADAAVLEADDGAGVDSDAIREPSVEAVMAADDGWLAPDAPLAVEETASSEAAEESSLVAEAAHAPVEALVESPVEVTAGGGVTARDEAVIEPVALDAVLRAEAEGLESSAQSLGEVQLEGQAWDLDGAPPAVADAQALEEAQSSDDLAAEEVPGHGEIAGDLADDGEIAGELAHDVETAGALANDGDTAGDLANDGEISGAPANAGEPAAGSELAAIPEPEALDEPEAQDEVSDELVAATTETGDAEIDAELAAAMEQAEVANTAFATTHPEAAEDDGFVPASDDDERIEDEPWSPPPVMADPYYEVEGEPDAAVELADASANAAADMATADVVSIGESPADAMAPSEATMAGDDVLPPEVAAMASDDVLPPEVAAMAADSSGGDEGGNAIDGQDEPPEAQSFADDATLDAVADAVEQTLAAANSYEAAAEAAAEMSADADARAAGAMADIVASAEGAEEPIIPPAPAFRNPIPKVETPTDYVATAESMHALYQLQLGGFEGPLDLLLHLIKRHHVDIFDIPIAFICERYLEYLKVMEDLDIDVASEFLFMASELLHLKSRMLLPRPEGEATEEEEVDPRAELVRRLLEYQKYKEVAERFGLLDRFGRDTFGREPEPAPPLEGEAPLKEVGLFALVKAFQGVLDRQKPEVRHQVMLEQVSVRQRIRVLVQRFEGQEATRFDKLLEDAHRRIDIVVTFLALLEMGKLKLLRIYQDEDGVIFVHPKFDDVSLAFARLEGLDESQYAG